MVLDQPENDENVPLVVDLDGTLLRSDILIESLLSYVRNNPFYIFLPLLWLLKGKAYLKSQLAKAAPIDVANLPYNSVVLDLIKQARDQGRKVVLATASHRYYADLVGKQVDGIDYVMATENDCNLSAHNKRKALVAEYGVNGFDYIGNSMDDLAVWEDARKSYLVNPAPRVEAAARVKCNVVGVYRDCGNKILVWIKAARLHQWLKNLLIFVPLLASHQITDMHDLIFAMAGFVVFGLCASSVYLMNDLIDIEDDRNHPRKRERPFASGSLSLLEGILGAPLLLILAIIIATHTLPLAFIAALVVYYTFTLAYTFYLKKKMMVDVITLATLYTLRIIAGTLALDLTLTFWMLAFSMFMFLSLALVKRYAELRDARELGMSTKTPGRGYYPGDLEMVSSLGAASGYLSVMVLALYIQDVATASLYSHPKVIWLACPLLLLWISRTWMLTHRGHMHDDPLIFAIKDRISIAIGVLFGLTFWFAA